MYACMHARKNVCLYKYKAAVSFLIMKTTISTTTPTMVIAISRHSST